MKQSVKFISGLSAIAWLAALWSSALLAQQVNTEPSLNLFSAAVQTKPLWEAGVLGGAFLSPAYPGAGQSRSNYIAVPYIIYRGERFRIGDGSVARAIAVEQRHYELDLSVDGAFNANSDDNTARAGMPDLDYMFELGPQLKLKLARFTFAGHDHDGAITLALPARAVFSSDLSSIAHRGYIFHPEFVYRQRLDFGKNTSFALSVSAAWGTESLQDYFFEVAPRYQTEQRQPYDARGGYLGSAASVRFSFDIRQDLRVYFSAALNSYAGAANRTSPIFSAKYGRSLGLGFVWRLGQSDTQITR